jgi:acetyltransferase-like isoleucine patch superfamily enzyme
VAVGVGAVIADGNHNYKDPTKHWADADDDLRPITIGEGAAILSNCTILASVGNRAVVGAHSVVTTPVPDYCLAVGAPARVVEYFGPPDLAPSDVQLPSPRHD